jgi:hypothetical protein
MIANWRENGRLRDIDKELAVAFGWHPDKFTVELADWGDGLYGVGPENQHRPVPQWSRGGRDTMNLIRDYGLTTIPPNPDSRRVEYATSWRVGVLSHTNTFMRRKPWLDFQATHLSLPEAVCACVLLILQQR